MRLATWNVNSLGARLPFVTGWLEEAQPDVLCVQETKLADTAFPTDVFADLGYTTAHYGDGRWNGVAILSRLGLDDPVQGFGSEEDEHGCRIVAGTCGGVRVHSVYVPNGRSLDNEFYPIKLAWLARLRSYLAETCKPSDAVAVCGDFNVAPNDTDVWDITQFEGMTHVGAPEREALAHVMDWGLEDVFLTFNEPGTFSWWDYRGGSFHRGQGMRIDHVLLTHVLAEAVTEARVDRQARKVDGAGNKPSDHAPVLFEFAVP